MGKLIFILGGAKSGKSSFALELAQKLNKKVTFIATAIPLDSEMKERIKNHRNARPKNWKTIEVTNNLDKKIAREKNRVILIDCLTIYVSHLMNFNQDKILSHIKKIIRAIKKSNSEVIVVSNEVGGGIVPNNKLGREYRDILGKVNQIFAQAVDEFYLMFAGIPINIKKYGKNQRDNLKN
jgi:adenosylcobinamide kinase/adenosylcobinamide-phosphate guanylyltransferase